MEQTFLLSLMVFCMFSGPLLYLFNRTKLMAFLFVIQTFINIFFVILMIIYYDDVREVEWMISITVTASMFMSLLGIMTLCVKGPLQEAINYYRKSRKKYVYGK